MIAKPQVEIVTQATHLLPVKLGALLLLCFISSNGVASLSENLLVGNARALALGNAVTADPPGIDSIMFNPAGLTTLPKNGWQWVNRVSVPQLKVEMDIAHPTNAHGNAPASWGGQWNYYCAHKIADPVFWGGYDRPWQDQQADLIEACGAPDANGNYSEANIPANVVSQMSQAAIMGPGVKMQKMDMPPIAPGFPGFAYAPPGAKWVFATAVYSELGGVARDPKDPGVQGGAEMISPARLSFLTPTIAYQVNERLSVGVGMDLYWQGLGMKMNVRLPNISMQLIDEIQDGLCDFSSGDLYGADSDHPVAELFNNVADWCGHEWGPFNLAVNFNLQAERNLNYNFNFGMLYKLTDWVTFGINYKPERKNVLKGQFITNYTEEWTELFGALRKAGSLGGEVIFPGADLICECFPFGSAEGTNLTLTHDAAGSPTGGFETGPISIDSPLPEIISLGMSMQVTPSVKLNIDARRTGWEVQALSTIDFEGQEVEYLRIVKEIKPKTITSTTMGIELGTRTLWHFAFGSEYTYSDRLKFQAGYENRQGAIPDGYQTIINMLGDADLYGLGLSYMWSPDTQLDLSLSQVSSKVDLPPHTSIQANSATPYELNNPYPGSYIKSIFRVNSIQMNWTTKY